MDVSVRVLVGVHTLNVFITGPVPSKSYTNMYMHVLVEKPLPGETKLQLPTTVYSESLTKTSK